MAADHRISCCSGGVAIHRRDCPGGDPSVNCWSSSRFKFRTSPRTACFSRTSRGLLGSCFEAEHPQLPSCHPFHHPLIFPDHHSHFQARAQGHSHAFPVAECPLWCIPLGASSGVPGGIIMPLAPGLGGLGICPTQEVGNMFILAPCACWGETGVPQSPCSCSFPS